MSFNGVNAIYFLYLQWECKTDMDNAYRFGSIAVTCEGYEYPDDPYILKGSCGVSFVLFCWFFIVVPLYLQLSLRSRKGKL